MTTPIRVRILDATAPLKPGDLSPLDMIDGAALKLHDNHDTGTTATVTSPRPVAAVAATPEPVPATAEQFGPMPVGYGSDPGLRRAAIGMLLYAAASIGLLAGLLMALGAQ